MVPRFHGLGLQSLPRMVVKWGMDPNGYGESSKYTVGNVMAKYGNYGRKVYDVTKRKWQNVFLGRPSQCIYRMVQGFLNHGIYLWFFYSFSFLGFLTLFWSGDKSQINAHIPFIYGEGIMIFWTIFSGNSIMKFKMKEIMVGIWSMAMV